MSGYIKDPNNSERQIPGPKPDNAYDRAQSPESCVFHKRPNSVVVGSLTGNLGLFFGTSASFAKNIHSSSTDQNFMQSQSQYTNFGALSSGTVLNLSPTAWSGSSGDVVTFVYRSGLSGGGV